MSNEVLASSVVRMKVEETCACVTILQPKNMGRCPAIVLSSDAKPNSFFLSKR
jgi:hypothetical protein